jgi:hypothetical protein
MYDVWLMQGASERRVSVGGHLQHGHHLPGGSAGGAQQDASRCLGKLLLYTAALWQYTPQYQ